MLLGSWCAARRSCANAEEDEDAVDVVEDVWLLLSEVGLPPVEAEEGSLVDSLQSGQFLMTRLTVSLMRTQ